MLISSRMTNFPSDPAGSAPPPAGTCRGVVSNGAPALCESDRAAADFDASVCAGEPGLERRRISQRWMLVGPYAVPAPPHLFVREIQRRVEAHFGLDPGAMRCARRDRRIARPRQIAMYLSRRLAGRSLPEIGRLFGDRDHTTVLHAVRAIEGLRLSDAAVERDVRALCLALTTPAR